ncbi:hypothetical protein J573_2149, partial [Acinetobacter baumannii 1546444]
MAGGLIFILFQNLTLNNLTKKIIKWIGLILI